MDLAISIEISRARFYKIKQNLAHLKQLSVEGSRFKHLSMGTMVNE
jgi:hypothetical protein